VPTAPRASLPGHASVPFPPIRSAGFQVLLEHIDRIPSMAAGGAERTEQPLLLNPTQRVQTDPEVLNRFPCSKQSLAFGHSLRLLQITRPCLLSSVVGARRRTGIDLCGFGVVWLCSTMIGYARLCFYGNQVPSVPVARVMPERLCQKWPHLTAAPQQWRVGEEVRKKAWGSGGLRERSGSVRPSTSAALPIMSHGVVLACSDQPGGRLRVGAGHVWEDTAPVGERGRVLRVRCVRGGREFPAMHRASP